MATANATASTPREQDFKPETPEGVKAATVYLKDLAKEGGWDSFDEFITNYLIPYAANRLRALDRWQAKQEKASGKKGKRAGTKKVAK